jgi:cytochrome c-type biogenesis protein CcmF
MLFFGWAGNAYKKEMDATLAAGKTMSIAGFTIRFDGLKTQEDLQKQRYEAQVTVFERGKPVRVAHMPARELFKKNADESPMTIPSITRFMVGDLYLNLASFEPERGVANLKAYWNPLVSWYWLGFMMLAFGTAICLAPDRAYAFATARRGVATATTVGIFLLATLGVIRSVHAQTAPPARSAPGAASGMGMPQARSAHESPAAGEEEAPVSQMTAEQKKLLRKMACMCGGCGREPLSNCACSSADRERARIRRALAAGQTPEDVLAAYVQRYGEMGLTMPKSAIVWALPYGVGIGALGLIALLGRRWTRRGRAGAAPRTASGAPSPSPAGAPRAEDIDSRYDERLEDELRDLD